MQFEVYLLKFRKTGHYRLTISFQTWLKKKKKKKDPKEQISPASGVEFGSGPHVRFADTRDTGYPVEQGLE